MYSRCTILLFLFSLAVMGGGTALCRPTPSPRQSSTWHARFHADPYDLEGVRIRLLFRMDPDSKILKIKLTFSQCPVLEWICLKQEKQLNLPIKRERAYSLQAKTKHFGCTVHTVSPPWIFLQAAFKTVPYYCTALYFLRDLAVWGSGPPAVGSASFCRIYRDLIFSIFINYRHVVDILYGCQLIALREQLQPGQMRRYRYEY